MPGTAALTTPSSPPAPPGRSAEEGSQHPCLPQHPWAGLQRRDGVQSQSNLQPTRSAPGGGGCSVLLPSLQLMSFPAENFSQGRAESNRHQPGAQDGAQHRHVPRAEPFFSLLSLAAWSFLGEGDVSTFREVELNNKMVTKQSHSIKRKWSKINM